jgi:hypothetical protein
MALSASRRCTGRVAGRCRGGGVERRRLQARWRRCAVEAGRGGVGRGAPARGFLELGQRRAGSRPRGPQPLRFLFARTDTGRFPASSSSSWCSGARATVVQARLALKVVVATRAAAPFAQRRQGQRMEGRRRCKRPVRPVMKEGKEVWTSVPGLSGGCMLAGPRWPARAVGWPVQCLQGHVLVAVEAGPTEICCGVRLGKVGVGGRGMTPAGGGVASSCPTWR